MPLPPPPAQPKHVNTEPSDGSATSEDTTSSKKTTTNPVRRRTTTTTSTSHHSLESSTKSTQTTPTTTHSGATTTSLTKKMRTSTSDTSVRWGHAITASPVPSTKAGASQQLVHDGSPERSSSPLDSGARKALISATTIGRSSTSLKCQHLLTILQVALSFS